MAAAGQVPTPPGAAYVGRTVTAVRVERSSGEAVEPAIRDLVETRAGEPLSLVQVRETVAYLFNLGRYQDIQVDATPDGAGVALRYVLVPLQTIERMVFRGADGLPASRLRSALEERFNGTPTVGRATAAARALQDLYAGAGYMRAHVEPSVETLPNGQPVLAFDIAAGPRARVGQTAVTGTPLVDPARLLDRLHVHTGEYYDQDGLARELDRYVAELRSRGYYEATSAQHSSVSHDGTVVDLTIDVHSGPLVTVSFEGDPLPSDRLAELVPIVREGSVDEDLLEDSDRRIETYLQGQGYWQARASHRPAQTDGRLAIVFTVTKGAQARVADVKIEGNHAVPTGDLRPLVRLKAGEPFVASRLDADVAAIEAHYQRLGYARVKVSSSAEPVSGTDRVDSGVAVAPRITVEEGPRTLVGRIQLEGNQVLAEPDIRAVMTLAPGKPFHAPQVLEDRDAVVALYLNHGYQSAQVGVERAFSEDASSVALTFKIHEGPQSLVDHILIVGNTRTNTSTIERELLLKPGDPLGISAIIESQQRLSALGLFRRVRITAIGHGEEARRDLLVVVEEAPATTLGYGGGLEGGRRLRTNPQGGPAQERIEIAPRGFFEIGRRNLWGKNRSIDLFTRVSVRPSDNPSLPSEDQRGRFTEYRVNGLYREPRAFGRSVDVLANAFLEQGVRTSFNFNRKGVNTELLRRLTSTVRVSGRYQFNYTRRFDERIDPRNQSLIDRLFPQVRLSIVSGNLFHDTRDDVVDPARGGWSSVDGELALRGIGSEVGFAKTYLQGFLYRTLTRQQPRRLTLAVGARVGLATGFPRDVVVTDENGRAVIGADGRPTSTRVRDVPASERFFAGGDTTVRGFTLDRLGTPETIDQNGFPKGGNGMVVFNGELRLKVTRSLGAVTFLDVGNVYARASDIALSEMRPSAGFGLRYQSPIGPLRIDLGFKLDRGAGERLTALHFSFGQAF
jgi:outer membrane protein assembly complex protein YaeT